MTQAERIRQILFFFAAFAAWIVVCATQKHTVDNHFKAIFTLWCILNSGKKKTKFWLKQAHLKCDSVSHTHGEGNTQIERKRYKYAAQTK